LCKSFVCNTYGIAPELLHLKDLEVNAIIEAQLRFFLSKVPDGNSSRKSA